VCTCVAAGGLAGCSLGGTHPGSASGPTAASSTAALTVRVARQVERMRIPAGDRPPLEHVRCDVRDSRATCTGRGRDGTITATQVFTIEPDGSLVPWCPADSGMPSIFCAR
jgi:hypothetical protein